MDKTKIDAPITEVLVMEDRAQVTRRSNLILRPGNYILELEDLTPLINEGNIQFYFEKNRAIVHNFQIKRRLKLESANSNLENDYQKSINDLEKQGRSLWYQIMNKTSRYNYLTKTSTALAKQMDEHLSLGNLNPNWIDGYAEIWKDQDDITYEVFDLTKKWEDIRFQFENQKQYLY